MRRRFARAHPAPHRAESRKCAENQNIRLENKRTGQTSKKNPETQTSSSNDGVLANLNETLQVGEHGSAAVRAQRVGSQNHSI